MTVNAGSNDLTLISGFNGPNPVTTTIPSGGTDPLTAFAFASGGGFESLVVGNAGDGVLALFEGGPEGLVLTSRETVRDLPNPSDLSFSALTGGQVLFYAATEGREAAILVALSLVPNTGSPTPAPPLNDIVQLVPLQESSLALAGTLLTLTIEPTAGEFGLDADRVLGDIRWRIVPRHGHLGRPEAESSEAATASRTAREKWRRTPRNAAAARSRRAPRPGNASFSAWTRPSNNSAEKTGIGSRRARIAPRGPIRRGPGPGPRRHRRKSHRVSCKPRPGRGRPTSQAGRKAHEQTGQGQAIDAILDSLGADDAHSNVRALSHDSGRTSPPEVAVSIWLGRSLALADSREPIRFRSGPSVSASRAAVLLVASWTYVGSAGGMARSVSRFTAPCHGRHEHAIGERYT